MKKTNLLLTISILLLSFTVNAQVNATQHVKKKLPLTYKTIVLNSAEIWGDDFEMQKHRIDKQCEAIVYYLKLNLTYKLPEDTFTLICFNALDKYSDNDIEKCIEGEFTFDSLGECLDLDWEMVSYEVEKQCQAYNELNEI